MFEELPSEEQPAARPRRLPWVLAAAGALLAVAAAAVAMGISLDRARVREALDDERARSAALATEAEDARAARVELEEQVRDLIDAGRGARSTTEACREAVAEAVTMWNELVRALEAAAEPDADAFERFADEAERSRDRVNASLDECEA